MNNFSEIIENYNRISKTIPKNILLVAVSKTHTIDKITEIYNLGQRIFGENKVQELIEKEALLPKDIQWHLIGHLQTNKVKYIASFIDTIQSVDSEKLLEEINRQAEKNYRKIKVLLQIKIAEEESKFGLEIQEAEGIFHNYLNGKFPHVEITGLMGLATFTENKDQTKKEFSFLKQIFDKMSLQKKLETLSMGMSDDYKIAMECGANSVRVGSGIFGQRNYDK
jgi:pyridoxal phosphate enzyme (YggS family)